MNWLITGGCGFIGRALIQHLLHDGGHGIRVFDNLSVGSRDDLFNIASTEEISKDQAEWSEAVQLVVGDIMHVEGLAQAMAGADVCVHLAANTGVAPSVEDPRSDCLTNVVGTLNVLESCRSRRVSRMVFASSGAPLGVQTPPLHEEMAPHPASPYGASKLAGEGYCSAYFHSFGIETVVLRFGNVYGEGSTKKSSVVAKFIKQALQGERLEIYGDGTQTRDFIYIGDLIRAVYAASITPGIGGQAFQIATSAETTVAELTEKLLTAIRAETGLRPTWINAEARVGDVQRNYSDTSKAQRMLDWRAEMPLEEGLLQTVRSFVAT